MMRPNYWRRLLAVPAVLSLSLGGALLAGAPANADPGDDLVITGPASGSTQTSLTFDVTGTGSDAAAVTVVNAVGVVVGGSVVEADGAFTATVTLPDAEPMQQALTVSQIVPAGSPTPAVSSVVLDVVLDVPAEQVPFALTSPTDGESIDSRVVDFVGTAPPGASVVGTIGDGSFNGVTAGADGSFSFQGTFPFEWGTDVVIIVSANPHDGTELAPIVVHLTLPAPIDAPVIVSPVTGATVTGPAPTVSGTGEPGVAVQLRIVPADAATLGANGGPADVGPLLPAFTVPEDGRWTYQVRLPAGNYSVVGLHIDPGEEDEPLDGQALSLLSNKVEFSVVAPAGVPTPELAATGPTTTVLIAPAALLLSSGLALLVLTRRRRVSVSA